MMSKIFFSLLIVFVLFTELRSTEHTDFILLGAESYVLPYMMWSEIVSDSIKISKISPSIEVKTPWESINNIYIDNWHSFNSIPIKYRFNSMVSINQNKFLRKLFLGNIIVTLNENLVLQNDFEVDSNGWDDDHFPKGQKLQISNKLTGYVQHASLSYYTPNGYLSIGRGNLYSTIYNNSVMINPHFHPVEFIRWKHNKNKLNIDWNISSLDSLNNKNRFLVVNRYAYKTNKFQFGVTEIGIIPYVELDQGTLRYLFPTSILYETEVNGRKNANIMLAFDIMIKYDRYTILSELLVDDFAIDGNSPPKIAYKIGLGVSSDFLSFFLDYNRINRWTGNYYDPELRYINDNILIGHPIGSDAHSLGFQFFKEFNNQLFCNIYLTFIQSGSSDINDWPEGIGNSSNFGYNYEKFPSGQLTNEAKSDFSLEYILNSKFSLLLSITNSSLDPFEGLLNIRYSI